MIKIDHGEDTGKTNNILVGNSKKFNRQQFDEVCRRLVEKHSSTFIELGLLDSGKNS
jgi:hypothetical protein